jgi:O-succinylbenzoic acid--CoA ligase
VAIALLKPNVILHEGVLTAHDQPSKHLEPGWILIPTGGSSGQIRFAIHTWQTLAASVDGFQQHFGCDRIQTCCVLPLYHVSGLMQVIRVLLTDGTLAIAPFRALESSLYLPQEPDGWFISLVPTQLQRLIAHSHHRAWLQRFAVILLGGAPAWSTLLDDARTHQLRIALTYGMTETASQVATLHPDNFLQGEESCGGVLPHAQIQIVTHNGEPAAPLNPGRIEISAQSLALGYCPESQPTALPHRFQTDDLGYFDDQNQLHVVGRHSQMILTGGENVFPLEVEAVLRESGCIHDVCVIGMPDPVWGEAVTAIYVPQSFEFRHPDSLLEAIAPHLNAALSRYKHPKYWIAVDELPRNAQGKVNRADVGAIAQQYLNRKSLGM